MTVRISAMVCGLALLLAVAIGAGTVGYWLTGDSAEAQGTWQFLKISGQGDPSESLKSLVEKYPTNCMIDFESNYYGENDTYDIYVAFACP
jgi:hypothetical protein